MVIFCIFFVNRLYEIWHPKTHSPTQTTEAGLGHFFFWPATQTKTIAKFGPFGSARVELPSAAGSSCGLSRGPIQEPQRIRAPPKKVEGSLLSLSQKKVEGSLTTSPAEPALRCPRWSGPAICTMPPTSPASTPPARSDSPERETASRSSCYDGLLGDGGIFGDRA